MKNNDKTKTPKTPAKINKVSVGQDEITRHLHKPVADSLSNCIEVPETSENYCWYQISSLGFGYERETDGVSAESEDKLLDYAASLFASCGKPFSILCEKTSDDVVFAIGAEYYEENDEKGNAIKKSLVLELLKSAFGTVKTKEYEPKSEGKSVLYAHSFEPIRTNADELDKRDTLSNIHMSRWADAIAKVLTQHEGSVRMDFHPVNDCKALITEARELCDDITTYLESNVQAGFNASDASKNWALSELIKFLGPSSEAKLSSSTSVSWKGVDSELTDLKKKAEYYIQLFSDVQQQGWAIEMTVSAEAKTGELSSSEKELNQTALTVPLTAALAQAGYSCKWSTFSKGTNGSNTDKEGDRAILLPSTYAVELISLPTTSFTGFERVKNRYYNVNLPHSDASVPFANLIQHGEKTRIEMRLPEREMNRHMFVCGMTGSGKTNTVHHLLSNIGDHPFLVIEPVKGEYHSLEGVTTYTMTAGSDTALYLNPFWFPKGSSLQYHIDYLKQIISSAFDLYEAMPNILEQCLTLTYQHSGWDFIKNENRYASELPEEMLYPTFSDLCHEVDVYLDRSKFGEEVKGNYRGALLSRLQSFTSGPKGMLLNTTKHLPCDKLNEGKVVISLDALADDADKAIVMGVIIAQYYEYLKAKCVGQNKKNLRHIVVIEEAHHLFAGDATPSSSSAEGGSGQSSSLKLVKTLNNMLAEIRAYGEGFIIVDQSPSALHPSVLKNTGIKIAHRIDYGQDIEALQDALLLDKDDRELATLEPGQALVHYGGMRTSAKVMVPVCKTKENSEILREEKISGNSLVNTLLEDSILSKYISENIVHRVINHLLYDDLNECKKIYSKLHLAMKTSLVRYGYSDSVDKITEDHLLAEYIAAFVPAELEKIFPNQHLTCKMISMFIERFLVLAIETDGDLSKSEIDAFEGYRAYKLYPRINSYFECSNTDLYRYALSIINNGPDLHLICCIAGNLVRLETKREDYEKAIKKRLTDYYFLCMPKHVELITSRVVGILSREEMRELLCKSKG